MWNAYCDITETTKFKHKTHAHIQHTHIHVFPSAYHLASLFCKTVFVLPKGAYHTWQTGASWDQLKFLTRIKNSTTNDSAVLLVSPVINVSLIKRPYVRFCKQTSTEVQLKYIVTNKSVCSTFRILGTGSAGELDVVCMHTCPQKLLLYMHKSPLWTSFYYLWFLKWKALDQNHLTMCQLQNLIEL